MFDVAMYVSHVTITTISYANDVNLHLNYFFVRKNESEEGMGFISDAAWLSRKSFVLL